MKSKLLIIEDNLMMREFLNHLLSKEYEVYTASSAEEALEWLQNNSEIDLIISDFNLDDMTGLDFLKHIKSSGFFQHIPVIILSGKNKSEDRITCLKEGAADYIIKPFNPTELLLRIQNVSIKAMENAN